MCVFPCSTSVENELHAYKPESGYPTTARLNSIIASKERMKKMFDLRVPSDATRIPPKEVPKTPEADNSANEGEEEAEQEPKESETKD